MPTSDALARQFMRDLEAGNTAALRRMTAALARSLPGLVEQATAAAERVNALKAEGRDAEAAVYARTRARAIAGQVEAEVRRLVRQLRPAVLNGQQAAVEAGLAAAERLTAAALGVESLSDIGLTWSRAPVEAVSALVGGLQDEGPLPRLLNQIAPDTGRRVREALTQGMLAGKNPRTIARTLRQEVGLSKVRAETIARTETLRAARAASVASYAQNRDVVKGYRRLAAKSGRTCPMCLALDGQEQESSEVMAIHPNCRCAVVPRVRTFRELGIDVDEPPRPRQESGADWFARQPAAVQRQVLGPGGLKAYQAGAPLSAFVRTVDDPDYGPTLRRATLAEVA